jgi:hypothetical protein
LEAIHIQLQICVLQLWNKSFTIEKAGQYNLERTMVSHSCKYTLILQSNLKAAYLYCGVFHPHIAVQCFLIALEFEAFWCGKTMKKNFSA